MYVVIDMALCGTYCKHSAFGYLELLVLVLEACLVLLRFVIWSLLVFSRV